MLRWRERHNVLMLVIAGAPYMPYIHHTNNQHGIFLQHALTQVVVSLHLYHHK
jgi:hypothetical protein